MNAAQQSFAISDNVDQSRHNGASALKTAYNELSVYVQAILDILDIVSRVIRNPTFCIGENKDADQLRGNREADQRLCFRYIDSTIPLLSKTEFPASSHLL